MKFNTKFIPVWIFTLTLLVSCQTKDDYREERIVRADEHFLKLQEKQIKDKEIITLPKCIELALKNNLDMKVYDLKLAVMRERKTAAMLGMLPDITATDDMAYRTNEPGARSVSLTGPNEGQTSLAYSKSVPRYVNRVQVEMLFSIIDFGLAYFSAVQQEDNKLITAEQQRRAAQNLIFDVTRAYIKVAGAQYVIEQVNNMLKMADNTDAILNDLSKDKKMPLMRVVDEQKRFLNLKKQLKEYLRTYENSCIELRSLMGYYPTSKLKVDTSAMDDLNKMKVLDVKLLERIALIERPELYQLDMQRHVTIVEARKTLIMMCPNVRAFVDFTGSSNYYLYNNQWWEVGMRAAYHLMRIPQQIGEYSALTTEAEQISQQALALSCGIIAQVRIAEANLREVEERYAVANQAYKVYSNNLVLATKKSRTTQDVSPFELKRLKMEKTYAGIERIETLGNYYLAYQRLLNAVGVETLDAAVIENLKLEYMETMADTVADNKEVLVSINTEISKNSTEIDNLNKKISDELKKIKDNEKVIVDIEDKLAGSDKELNMKIASKKSEYKENIQKIKEIINSHNKKIEQIRNSIKQTQDEYSDSVNSKREAHKNALGSIKEQISTNNTIIQNSEAELEGLYDKKLSDEDLVKSKNEIEKRIDTAENEIDSLEDKLSDIIDKHEEDLASHEDKFKATLEKYNDDIESCQDAIEEEYDNIEDKEDSLEDILESVADNHSDQLDNNKDELTTAKENIKLSREVINDLKNKIAKYEAKCKKLNNELKESKDQMDVYNNNLDAFNKAKNVLLSSDDKDKVNITLPKNMQETPSQAQQTLVSPVEATQGVTGSDIINMEAQQQSGVNNISPEEYQNNLPNVQMETMRDSDDNELNAFEYDPGLSKNIDQQSVYENVAGNINRDNMETGTAGPSGDFEGSNDGVSFPSQGNAEDGLNDESIYNPPITDWTQPGRNGDQTGF